MTSRRANVYLDAETAPAVDAAGVSLAELVRRGLGRPGAVTAPRPGVVVSPADCPHRGLKGGAWCKTCASMAPERRKG